jgi:hypothetical protein
MKIDKTNFVKRAEEDAVMAVLRAEQGPTLCGNLRELASLKNI